MQYIFDGKCGRVQTTLFHGWGGRVPPQIYCGDAHENSHEVHRGLQLGQPCGPQRSSVRSPDFRPETLGSSQVLFDSSVSGLVVSAMSSTQ